MKTSSPSNQKPLSIAESALPPQKPVQGFDLEEAIDATFLNSFVVESNEKWFL